MATLGLGRGRESSYRVGQVQTFEIIKYKGTHVVIFRLY